MTIKEAREVAGLTRKELSDMLEIPYATLEHWDRGDRNPPVWAEKMIIEKLTIIAKEKKDVKMSDEFKNEFIDLLIMATKKKGATTDNEVQKLYCGMQLGGNVKVRKLVEKLEQSFVVLDIPMTRDIQLRFYDLKTKASGINYRDNRYLWFQIMAINIQALLKIEKEKERGQ